MKAISIHTYLSPQNAYRLAERCSPWLLLAALVLLSVGLYGALVAAPVDYQQGAVYRIMYVHVPCAILSLGLYSTMAIAAFVFLVWKIKVMDVIASVCAPACALFTLLTLATGAIWGQPTWGTWWVWDARLTSELILFFIVCGAIALRHGLNDMPMGAKAVSVFVLIGAINIPIIHFSVDWWQTLHQGASILRFGSPNIAPSMLHPLLAMIAGMISLAAYGLSLLFRSELLKRSRDNRWARELQQAMQEKGEVIQEVL